MGQSNCNLNNKICNIENNLKLNNVNGLVIIGQPLLWKRYPILGASFLRGHCLHGSPKQKTMLVLEGFFTPSNP